MLRKLAVAALLGGLATGALVASATAQCVSPVLISIGADSFAYEDMYQTAPADSFDSHPGSKLTVVGKIVCFGPPLDYLKPDTTATGKEYTFVWNLTSLGTKESVPANTNGENWDTAYSGGTFSVYEDPARNAPVAANMPPNPPVAGVVPDKFADGTLILTGVFDVFTTQVTLRKNLSGTLLTFGGSWNANYHFTGGRPAEFGLLATTVASAGATWCTNGTGRGQCTSPAGYSAHTSGVFDVPVITPTSRSTWGRIKLLYR